MISPGDKIVVGLSGGADSSVLLLALKKLCGELNLELCAAHLNHGIRNGEADRDMEFSSALSQRLGVSFVSKRVSVPDYASAHRISEETAGRELRYKFFAELCSQRGLNKIAVAHNMNDRAESVLLNLSRGSGALGLAGIRPVNGNIIRPLIEIDRNDIEKYARENEIGFMTDSTNLTDVYARNIIRRNVMPQLKRVNNKAEQNIVRCSSILSLESEFMDEYVKSLSAVIVNGDCVKLDRRIFLAQHKAIQRRLVFEAVRLLKGSTINITQYNADSVSQCSRTGAVLQFPGEIQAVIEHDCIVFSKKPLQIPEYEYNLKIPGKLTIAQADMTLEFEIVSEKPSGRAHNVMLLDYDKLGKEEITLRSKRAGDFFSPSGMDGTKKVKKFFTDNKIPSSRRNGFPLLTANGEIAAVIPLRVSRNYIIDDFTRHILMIRITGGNNG